VAGQVYVKSGKSFRYESTEKNVVGLGYIYVVGNVFVGNIKQDLNTKWKKVIYLKEKNQNYQPG
jgi:hypothetical protein